MTLDDCKRLHQETIRRKEETAEGERKMFLDAMV